MGEASNFPGSHQTPVRDKAAVIDLVNLTVHSPSVACSRPSWRRISEKKQQIGLEGKWRLWKKNACRCLQLLNVSLLEEMKRQHVTFFGGHCWRLERAGRESSRKNDEAAYNYGNYYKLCRLPNGFLGRNSKCYEDWNIGLHALALFVHLHFQDDGCPLDNKVIHWPLDEGQGRANGANA